MNHRGILITRIDPQDIYDDPIYAPSPCIPTFEPEPVEIIPPKVLIDWKPDTPSQEAVKSTPYQEAAKRGDESCRKIDKKMVDIQRPIAEGKFISYVFSFEMLNTILANMKGRAYNDQKKAGIIIALNSPSNIKMKNTIENDGISSDIKSDILIMNALNAKREEEKKLSTKTCVNRLMSIWNTVQKIDLPADLKNNIQKQFSLIKDKNGNNIIE